MLFRSRISRLLALMTRLLAACGRSYEAEVPCAELRAELNLTQDALEEDLTLLNLINFGGGCYALFALVEGDEVVVLEPMFDSYAPCIAMAGAVARPVTIRPPHYTIDADELRAAFSAKTKLVLLNTPHNPTGRVFSDRKSTRLNSSHVSESRMPSSA